MSSALANRASRSRRASSRASLMVRVSLLASPAISFFDFPFSYSTSQSRFCWIDIFLGIPLYPLDKHYSSLTTLSIPYYMHIYNFVNRNCAIYHHNTEFYNRVVKKKRRPVTVHIDILPTSRSKRSEGLDILARLIARDIMIGNSHPLRRHCPQGKEDK